MTEEKIKRINELARKQKAAGLTEEEKENYPLKCPHCLGVPDGTRYCPYCGGKLV